MGSVKGPPWDVTNLDVYLIYLCPECGFQSPKSRPFKDHMMTTHSVLIAGTAVSKIEKSNDFTQENHDSNDDVQDMTEERIANLNPRLSLTRVSLRSQEAKYPESDDDDDDVDDNNFENDDKSDDFDENDDVQDISEDKFANLNPSLSLTRVTLSSKEAQNVDNDDDENIFNCHNCKISFNTLPVFRKHMAVVHKIVYNRGKSGGKKSSSSKKDVVRPKVQYLKGVKKAEEEEVDEEAFDQELFMSCPAEECSDRRFDSFVHLKTHWEKMHGGIKFVEEAKPSSGQRSSSKRWGKTFLKCKMCQEEFKTFYHLRSHWQKIHRGDNEEEVDLETNPEEKFTVVKRRPLEDGDIMKSFKCDHCSYETHSEDCRGFHMKIKHGDKSKLLEHTCQECGYKADYLPVLTSHIKRVHENYKPHKCQDCGERMFSLERLRAHREKFHIKIPFLCPQCGKQFETSANLKLHVKLHHENSMGGPSPCSLCGKVFDNKRALQKHMYRVHKETNAIKVVCDQCGKEISQKHMKVHLLRAHKQDLPLTGATRIIPKIYFNN